MISIEEIQQTLKSRNIKSHTTPDLNGEEDLTGIIEVWYRKRKLTFYCYNYETVIIRVWGPNIETEMAEYTIQVITDVTSHVDWLIGG